MNRQASALLGFALAGHILMWAAAAVGTIFATLDGLTRWVAVTVGFHHAISSFMQTFRVDERRAACRRAVSALESAKLRWKSLPKEQQTRQENIDNVVGAVERALEATLPPKPADAKDQKGGKED